MTKYKTIEKRPEDGYGTDRIPGGWGGEDSFEPIEPIEPETEESHE